MPSSPTAMRRRRAFSASPRIAAAHHHHQPPSPPPSLLVQRSVTWPRFGLLSLLSLAPLPESALVDLSSAPTLTDGLIGATSAAALADGRGIVRSSTSLGDDGLRANLSSASLGDDGLRAKLFSADGAVVETSAAGPNYGRGVDHSVAALNAGAAELPAGDGGLKPVAAPSSPPSPRSAASALAPPLRAPAASASTSFGDGLDALTDVVITPSTGSALNDIVVERSTAAPNDDRGVDSSVAALNAGAAELPVGDGGLKPVVAPSSPPSPRSAASALAPPLCAPIASASTSFGDGLDALTDVVIDPSSGSALNDVVEPSTVAPNDDRGVDPSAVALNAGLGGYRFGPNRFTVAMGCSRSISAVPRIPALHHHHPPTSPPPSLTQHSPPRGLGADGHFVEPSTAAPNDGLGVRPASVKLNAGATPVSPTKLGNGDIAFPVGDGGVEPVASPPPSAPAPPPPASSLPPTASSSTPPAPVSTSPAPSAVDTSARATPVGMSTLRVDVPVSVPGTLRFDPTAPPSPLASRGHGRELLLPPLRSLGGLHIRAHVPPLGARGSFGSAVDHLVSAEAQGRLSDALEHIPFLPRNPRQKARHAPPVDLEIGIPDEERLRVRRDGWRRLRVLAMLLLLCHGCLLGAVPVTELVIGENEVALEWLKSVVWALVMLIYGFCKEWLDRRYRVTPRSLWFVIIHLASFCMFKGLESTEMGNHGHLFSLLVAHVVSYSFEIASALGLYFWCDASGDMGDADI